LRQVIKRAEPVTREEALAKIEEALARASQASRPQRAPDAALMGCIVHLIGGAAVLVGCCILIAVLSGYKRPLRSLGIATTVEMGILLVALGAFVGWMGTRSGQETAKALEPAAPAAALPMKNCVSCAEEIPADATTCEHCYEPQS
jgi:hypothetical protein